MLRTRLRKSSMLESKVSVEAETLVRGVVIKKDGDMYEYVRLFNERLASASISNGIKEISPASSP